MSAQSQDCTDRLLLDVADRAVSVGLDSSGRWWAITQPYDSLKGLNVDGQSYGPFENVIPPIFTYDASSFVSGFKRLGQWSVLTEDDTIALKGDILHSTFLPTLSTTPWWLHSNGSDHWLSTYERSYRLTNMPNAVCFDPQGLVIAWLEKRSNLDVLFVNGKETVMADEIRLGGVWVDGTPLYAVRFGTRWSVYRGQDEIVSSLASLVELRLNPSATVCAWIASDGSSAARIYMYTTDMNAPWTSLPLQSARNLSLSPFDPLVAALINRNGNQVVSYNSAEYPAGRYTSPISFSHNGAIMVYGGVDGDNFVTLNGKRHVLKVAVNLSVPINVSTDGSAVGWASATTLAYVNLDLDILRLGKMCDQMGPVIFDRRTKTFKGLGFVSGRLFLLECDYK